MIVSVTASLQAALLDRATMAKLIQCMMKNSESPTMPAEIVLGSADTFAHFLSDEDPWHRAAAVQMVVMGLRKAGDLVSSSELALSLIDIVIAWNPHEPAHRLATANIVTDYAGLAFESGSGRTLLDEADRWCAILDALGQGDAAKYVRLCEAEVAIMNGLYERAWETLKTVEAEGVPQTRQSDFLRLKGKISELLTKADAPIPPRDAGAVLASALDTLANLAPESTVRRYLAGRGIADIDPAAFAMAAFPPVPDTLQELDAASVNLEAARSPFHAVSAVIQGAHRTLHAARDEASYRSVAAIAARASAAADRFGYWEEGTTAGWLQTVALRRAAAFGDEAMRLAHYRFVLEKLLVLTARINERRTRIRDPRLRAGVAILLPGLPWITAEVAVYADEPAVQLYAMESAKARILGDLRDADMIIPSAPEFQDRLAGLIAGQPRTHVLSFLIDTEMPDEPGVRALLRTADGEWFGTLTGLSAATIRAAAEIVDGLVRGRPKVTGERVVQNIFQGDPDRRPFSRVFAMLAPLISWIEPLYADNVFKEGDTLLYSADGALHNIPLGMLPFLDGALIDRFALCAMPSLLLALAQGTAPSPSSAAVIVSPLPGDDPALDDLDTLHRVLDSVKVLNSQDEIGALVQCGLIHVTAHGVADARDPLRASYIAVAPVAGGAVDDETARLTAERLALLSLDGVHMGFRSCLVGQVSQITSREALGVVWGVLSAQTASLVAASWTVSGPSSSRWFAHFYAAWLGEGQSRAQAHRTACLALRAERAHYTHPCHWAPFVLYAATLDGDVL